MGLPVCECVFKYLCLIFQVAFVASLVGIVVGETHHGSVNGNVQWQGSSDQISGSKERYAEAENGYFYVKRSVEARNGHGRSRRRQYGQNIRFDHRFGQSIGHSFDRGFGQTIGHRYNHGAGRPYGKRSAEVETGNENFYGHYINCVVEPCHILSPDI